MPRPTDHSTRHHFDITEAGRAKCRYCHHTFVFNATRGRKHLLSCWKYKTSKSTQAESSPSIKSYGTSISGPTLRAQQLRVAKLIYCDGRPFSLFESEHSRALFFDLNPAFKPPSYEQLAGPLLCKVYDEYKAQVKERLSRSDRLNIIFDGSDNING